jgi:hypothetical protein
MVLGRKPYRNKNENPEFKLAHYQLTVNLDEQYFLILRNVEGLHFAFIQVVDICSDNVPEVHIDFSLVFRARPGR